MKRISLSNDWEREDMTGGRCRILVIEDDRETAEQLVDSLAMSGYEVDLAVDGNDGLRRGRSGEYAVMTIDRMLPGIDGVAIIQRLRQDGIVTPALIVSALGEIDDRVRGLRAGGDDYLVKPFAFVELLARVEALARRSDTVVKETVLRVGDLTLDLVSRTATRNGRKIELLLSTTCGTMAFDSSAARMSEARISPPGPDPRTWPRSTLRSAARRRALGEIRWSAVAG